MSQPPASASRHLLREIAGATLHQRFVFVLGALAFALVALLAWGADIWLRSVLAGLPAEHAGEARMGVLLGAAFLLAFVLVGLGLVNRFVMRSVSAPALRLAALAERVAAGDLALAVPGTGADNEMGRLSRATEAMLGELRRLVAAIDDSARRTSHMAAEITGGTEQMTQTAVEIAQTSNDLSGQSAEMAETIQQAVVEAGALRRIAGELTSGARGGVERNAQLRELARHNRARLDASTQAFDRLVDEAEFGTSSADALAIASDEIRAFLTLVRKMSRQTKLLALNASMEAARAGEVGEGFAVVANEIRKMSAGATEAAERTQKVVDDVLARVQETRESSRRTLGTVEKARQATSEVITSFAELERMVAEMDGWTASIDAAARDSASVVEATTRRLEQLAHGIEGFAAAMQQVAAASQEQSASTEEIAAAAAALAGSSRELAGLVRTFRLARGSLVAEERERGREDGAPSLGVRRLATA